ncbi:MAG: N-acetyltransferase [Hyphomicrobiaceae bacterium]|nr:N-acetyltransferase [Hyphomicrobiaceae bacterium]
MNSAVELRAQEARDAASIRSLLTAAFPTAAEADLVEQLHKDGDAVISLVAIVGDEVAGFILLSRMLAPQRALGLAPLAVSANHQHQGIASRLVDTALSLARERDWKSVFVLGDPGFYQRFGFDAELAAGFTSPYAGPYLMVRPLTKAGLDVTSGPVDYAPAFAALG